MQNKGLIWASDRAAWRLQKLKRRAARARMFNYRLFQWDGARKVRTKFDGVLLDAPCSGVGTWHRNPHARWTTTLEDVIELKELQHRLLVNAAASVKSGGKLIYAVCTLTRAETTEVATEFERIVAGFSPLLMRHPLTGSEASQLWIWPQEFGGNGMFVAAWRRQT
jgi:16S rRNA (cytosine967-C5)-methyltransferase